MLRHFWEVIIREKIIFLIVIISFLISIFYSFIYSITPNVDARAYDKIAVNIIDGFGFREDNTKSYEFDTAIVRAGPGYEFFLAGIYRIFGHHYGIVWIIQAILHALSALLLFFISYKIFGEKGKLIGFFAAVFFGLHPDLIEIAAMLMTETLYLFLIVLVVYIYILVYEQPRKTILSGLLGLVVSIAILTRPTVILFVPVMLFAYYRLKCYRQAIWFCLSLLLLITPWVIRNYFIYHQFIITTLIGEYNLWIGNTVRSNGGQISDGFNPLTAFTDVYGFFGLKARVYSEFWSFIFTYPFIFFKLCFLRFIRYFSLLRPMGFWFYQKGIKQLIFVASSAGAIAVLFISGFSGMIMAWKEKNPLFYYLIIFALTSPMALIPTVVQSRYRFQIYPFLAIFGGYFLANLNFKKIFMVVGVILLIISFIDFISFLPSVVERIHFLI